MNPSAPVLKPAIHPDINASAPAGIAAKVANSPNSPGQGATFAGALNDANSKPARKQTSSKAADGGPSGKALPAAGQAAPPPPSPPPPPMAPAAVAAAAHGTPVASVESSVKIAAPPSPPADARPLAGITAATGGAGTADPPTAAPVPGAGAAAVSPAAAKPGEMFSRLLNPGGKDAAAAPAPPAAAIAATAPPAAVAASTALTGQAAAASSLSAASGKALAKEPAVTLGTAATDAVGGSNAPPASGDAVQSAALASVPIPAQAAGAPTPALSDSAAIAAAAAAAQGANAPGTAAANAGVAAGPGIIVAAAPGAVGAAAALAISHAAAGAALAADSLGKDKHAAAVTDAAAVGGPNADPAGVACVVPNTPGAAPDAVTPTLRVHAGVDSAEFAQGLAERVSWMVDNSLNGAKLQVNPPALGPIELRIAVTGDHAQVWMSSHSAVTRDALEASSAKLREMLGAQGFGQVSVDISQRSFHDRSRYSQPYEAADRSGSQGVAVASVTASASRGALGVVDAYA